jgi:hypothetical protein
LRDIASGFSCVHVIVLLSNMGYSFQGYKSKYQGCKLGAYRILYGNCTYNASTISLVSDI